MQHLARTDHGDHHESSSGPDLDPDSNKRTGPNYNKHSRFFNKGENAKGSVQVNIFALWKERKKRQIFLRRHKSTGKFQNLSTDKKKKRFQFQ